MEEFTFKTIRVDAVNDTEKKVTLLAGKDKYNFWKKKQDGSLTKAYSQFQEHRVASGSEYPIAVKEQEKTFRNDAGKDITFVDRSIMYFAFKEAGEGQVAHTVEQQEDHSECQERFEKMLAWAKKMEGEVASLKALVEEVAGKDATDLHTSIQPRAEVRKVAEELGGVLEDTPDGFDDFRPTQDDYRK